MTINYTMSHATARRHRAEALECGESYYVGTQCPKGHDGTRYVASGNCVACTRALGKRSRFGTFKTPANMLGEGFVPSNYPFGRPEAKEHGSQYYNPNGGEEFCKRKHMGLYRTSDGKCMSCHRREMRHRKKARALSNRARYVPVWLK